MARLTDSLAMILVVYNGRKGIKEQNYNNTHSERHTTYASDTNTSYQKVNNVGYFRCSGNAQIAS